MKARSVITEGMFMTHVFLIFIFKLSSVISLSNQSCYICVEPLVGYTDHLDSCRSFNPDSERAISYMQYCTQHERGNYSGEYECRKLVVSYRSVDIYLRRDCVPKGRCSWKDKSQSMIYTPASNCVYTDDGEQKLECIYCCDTPFCNRAKSLSWANSLLFWLFLVCSWRKVLPLVGF